MPKESNKDMSISEKDFFSEDNVAESNWFAFDEVGKQIYGTLLQPAYLKKGRGNLPDQMVYVLQTDDREIWNVGISVQKTFVNDRLKSIIPGQYIGFKFVKEVPASQKGFSPAKSIVPYAPKGADGKPLMNDEWLAEHSQAIDVDNIPME